MKLQFVKYQATGNDFVLVDNRNENIKLTIDQIVKICDRKFGVGADGLMLIENHPTLDFNLVYYNSDGTQSLCGNGSRAAVKLASELGIVNGKATFNAYDGPHEAEVFGESVRLKMNDVSDSIQYGESLYMNTGSPHYIEFVDHVQEHEVVKHGRNIRYSKTFEPAGTNVNFVELLNHNSIYVRTYERGVENETLSCGTGVTASALASYFKGYTSPVAIKTLGGDLSVQFTPLSSGHSVTFRDIFLIGPAKKVFDGTLEL